MTSQSQGIQQLLQAEKRAAEKVAEARKRKARRLKQAKEEAQVAIEAYRQQRENDFRQRQEAVLGSQGDLVAKVQERTTSQIKSISRTHQENREYVLNKLLKAVCDVQPEIHPNFHI
uniref:V-type proton ATPase subunit G n=1 Tax=Eptatretus burgeri TaxID=7764 RepID=A0A8C4NL08_EPTBU